MCRQPFAKLFRAATLNTTCFLICLLHINVGHTDVYLAPEATLDWLGKGFDSFSSFPKQHCVQGQTLGIGNTHAKLNYRAGHTTQQRMEENFGKIKGSLNLVVFSGSASVEVFTRTSENETSASSVLQLDYNAQDVSLEQRTLTTLGNQMIGRPGSEQRQQCGDEFIHHIKLGSNLYVTAKLHFRSKDEYERYKTKIKIRVLFFKKTKTITKEFKKYTENAVYSIKVIANGGMTEQLRHILDNNPGYCRTEQIEDCVATTTKLFDYLFSEGGYADDLQNSDLNVLSFSTSSYSDSGHFDLDPELNSNYDPGFRILEQKLTIKLQENIACQDRLSAFKAVETDEAIIAAYQEKLDKINSNIDNLKQAVDTCKIEPEFAICRSAVDNTLLGLHTIDCN